MQKLFLAVLSLISLQAMAQDSAYSLKMKLTGHTKSLETVAYSPDGKWLASAGWDKEVHIYRADTPNIGKLEFNLTGPYTAVTCLSFSKDGGLIASGSKDNGIRVYKTTDGGMYYSNSSHTKPVTHIIMDPSGKFLMSSSEDGTLAMHNMVDANSGVKSIKYGTPINSFAMAPNGKSLYVASTKGEVDNINFKGGVVKSFNGHTAQVNCLEISPNRKFMATGSDDKTIIIWDLATGKEVKRLEGHTWKVTSLNYSSDGAYLVSSCNDGSTIVWDVETGKPLVTLTAMGSNARCAVFSPDMTKIAVATEMATTNQGALIYNTPLKKPEPKKAEPAKPAVKKNTKPKTK